MKKFIYVSLFTFLGILVSFLLHGIIEIAVVELLLYDFSVYSLGLTWAQWFTIHHWASWALLLLGAGVGFWQGEYWWYVLYEEGEVGGKN